MKKLFFIMLMLLFSVSMLANSDNNLIEEQVCREKLLTVKQERHWQVLPFICPTLIPEQPRQRRNL
ncbi:MAG: hypothetical protein U0Z17_06785 [Bacteroidales bacterium]